MGALLLITGCGDQLSPHSASAWRPPSVITHSVGSGWSGSSVNAAIFRRDALVTHHGRQYIGYYGPDGTVVLGRRRLASGGWTLQRTRFEGRVADGHNAISLGVDGAGVLHMAWDHHRDPLRYARALAPDSLSLGQPESMLGVDEDAVTYPEFHRLPEGDLLFLYRNGSAGRGSLIVNRYRIATGTWERVHTELLTGDDQRNAYWQFHVDARGVWHLSWTWRENPDASSNHDLYYMRSTNEGLHWEDSTGRQLDTPVGLGGAELVAAIPMQRNLINQTSIWAGADGVPFIATYFRERPTSITQIHVLYPQNGRWIRETVSDRRTDFELAEGGTRALPISRPRIIGQTLDSGGQRLYVIYRDEAKDNRIVLATRATSAPETWQRHVLPSESLERWEPTLDAALWQDERQLHLFVQRVYQKDGDVWMQTPPTPVSVMEVTLD